jgi:hypothetical protein
MILCAFVVRAPLAAQSGQTQIVAIRAGRLFDPKAGTKIVNQVVLVSVDKVTDVGPAASVKIPAAPASSISARLRCFPA